VAYSIARLAKQKGGNVGSSSLHNSRQRQTLNADPSREHENKIIIGDPEIEVPQRVREIIHEHGGKPRKDSVEAVEMLLTASPEWWRNDKGEFDKDKVDQFCKAASRFLLDQKNGGICARATLHLDERSPHIHAHVVPIDPKGKLSCKYYFGDREKCSKWQTAFFEEVKHLGLERGKEQSYARHTDVKEFYAQITHEHEIKLDYQRLPDPPRMLMTSKAAQRYKEELAKAVIEQAKEPIQTELHQAMLARDSHAARVETEKRLAAQKEISEREKERADKAVELGERYQREYNKLRHDVLALTERCEKAESRIGDIPMTSVMRLSGWNELPPGRDRIQAFVHPSLGHRVRLEGSTAYDELTQIGYTAIDLVQHLHRVEGNESSPEKAAIWLVDKFGKEEARKAYMHDREKSTHEFFKAHDLQRHQRPANLVPVRDREVIERAEPVRDDQGPKRSDKADRTFFSR
jgi:hypothetical protein